MISSQSSDDELVSWLQKGHGRAFEEIYRRYWYKLYNVAFQQTGTREEAEELVQNLFENLWHRRDQLTIRHLSSYLIVAIRYASTNYLKDQITHRKFQEYLILHEIRQSFGTDDQVQFTDLARAVDDAMKKLPEKSGEIFRMSRFDGQSVKAIADRLNLSEKAVEYHITKSLKVLKEQLKAYHTNN
ncbi:RNA polymerase sigma-70 factor [Spirosoma sp. 209]|uniref:RNA polymerase sigma-70 factor n=1 Tax=Spirosoma sp. 209 TaxID=1955701 RepID=UPI00098D5AAC|nr:RNA polymerase sigma-70 factor [Spirosoma sp. 209]